MGRDEMRWEGRGRKGKGMGWYMRWGIGWEGMRRDGTSDETERCLMG